MEDRLTSASDLDCSRGSDFTYCKDLKNYIATDIEIIKKTYQKRKNIMRKYSISLNNTKHRNILDVGNAELCIRPDVMTSDTPVEKFTPRTRPSLESGNT
ncbi:hypothetical protein SteCoe_11744 [Stentor coeruleus]|uniref:Uncharacterized protein n=1 Tax=Stentor coeruleus TaxID=5963 RepID=A0A1R2CCG8_9CILI|nr:hypothetical protein SteCoe_11744 [Stentor coeruleus]